MKRRTPFQRLLIEAKNTLNSKFDGIPYATKRDLAKTNAILGLKVAGQQERIDNLETANLFLENELATLNLEFREFKEQVQRGWSED